MKKSYLNRKTKSLAVLQLIIFFVLVPIILSLPAKNRLPLPNRLAARLQINIGPCTWIIDRKCPDSDIKFYLYTRRNRKDRQHIYVDDSLEQSSLFDSYFNPNHPTKIIIHGYNSDMFLSPLIQMKEEYLDRADFNLFYVDWSVLAPGPCYPSAAQNTRHAGKCIAQLVERIKESGTENVHIIGFSLGAHVANFIANNVKSFKIPRITGLDPALPLFITASEQDKLDKSDAMFVDVIHSNALIQGKIEQCGHADFYMNGGVLQPGCFQSDTNPIACSHHRAPDYFSESIKSERGFWGWACSSYINYLLGMCPRTNNLHQAGEDCRSTSQGMYLITTNNISPYASGQWMMTPGYTRSHYRRRDPFEEQIDEWGKLEGEFNYVPNPNHRLGNPSDWSQLNRIGSIFANFDKLDASTRSDRWRQNDRHFIRNESLKLNDLNPIRKNEDFSLPKIIFEES